MILFNQLISERIDSSNAWNLTFIEEDKFKFKLNAPAEYVIPIQTYFLQIIKIFLLVLNIF